jgi:hypothetical protein
MSTGPTTHGTPHPNPHCYSHPKVKHSTVAPATHQQMHRYENKNQDQSHETG